MNRHRVGAGVRSFWLTSQRRGTANANRRIIPILIAAGLFAGTMAVHEASYAASKANPVGLVQEVDNAPKAGLRPFDYVYRKQKLDLRPDGHLKLTYFDSCREETIKGGRVRIGRDKSRVTRGGEVTVREVACKPFAVALNQGAREAGASVKRIALFDPQDWREWTVNTEAPIFKWPAQHGALATISVRYLDSTLLTVIWQAQTEDNHYIYPAQAPRLEVGKPYLVKVSYDSGDESQAVFSIDPNLTRADTPLNKMIALAP